MSITSQCHVVTVVAVNQKYVSRGGSCKCQSPVQCHMVAVITVNHHSVSRDGNCSCQSLWSVCVTCGCCSCQSPVCVLVEQ